ncbi:MAG: choice-of-anchor D domain-containing protein, partial [bacterium]
MTIFSNDADRPTVTISLSGQGCSRPEIAVNPPSWDYGDVGVGSFADKSFVVSNDGCQNLEVTGTSLVGTDADQFAIVGGGGAFTVNQGGAHIIVVRFSPTSAGTKNATLRIMSNDPDEGTKDVPLSGGICVPPEPDIAVDPAFWDYGPVAIGGTEDKTFAVSNVGCQDLVVTATTVVGADAGLFTIISGGGPFTLNRGGSHDIILRFEPLTEGDKSATLQIASNDPDEPTKDVSLIGEGCGPPNISVDPASWDFGLVDVTGSSDITIVVSNTGCQDLEVTGTNIVGANPDQFSIVSGGGSFTVVRGATHNIVVRFAPTSGGTKNGGLQILSTDPDEGGLIVPLTGQGCSLQDIAVDPASWDYGVVDLGGYEEKSFVVSNDGCQDLAVTGTSLVGADPDQFSIVSGGGAFTIPQGGSHDVVVRFAPTSTGNKSAALRITSNDPDEPTVDVEVTGGVCVFPDIVVDPETWDYGSVDVGADVDKEIIISNDGCQDLEVTGTGLVGADSDQFSIVSGGAPFSVAQGETHGVTVRFSPSSPGTKNAGLRINSNDPDQGVVTIPLNGLGCGDPDIAMDPASWDYGEIDVGSSADVNIAVSNVGCQVLQVAATNLTGANPDQFSIVSGEGPFSVVQGGTHNLVVRFSPTSGGNKSGRLQILSNDPDEGTVNVALTGEGCVVADISIDPLFWDYGTIDVGDYGEKTIVVTNTGCQVLQVTATTVVGADPTEFSIVSGGG